MPTYKLRCGRCGYTYYLSSFEPDTFLRLGATFQRCPQCGGYLYYPYFKEWICMTSNEKKFSLCFGFGASFKSFNPNSKFLRFVRRKTMEKWDNFKFEESMLEIPEIKESIERTQNEEYKKMLILKGYSFYGTRIE